MKVEKLPSGTYRVRKMYKGTTYTLTFPYKPTTKEVMEKMTDALREEGFENTSNTFEFYANEYIRLEADVPTEAEILEGKTAITTMVGVWDTEYER